jgi:ubiquitin-like 1-activating enzyme E1 B
MTRATLNDLVEDFLRLGLSYGEEFTVNNEVGVLYDVEETDNLEKKLSDLGMSLPYLFACIFLTLAYRY